MGKISLFQQIDNPGKKIDSIKLKGKFIEGDTFEKVEGGEKNE